MAADNASLKGAAAAQEIGNVAPVEQDVKIEVKPEGPPAIRVALGAVAVLGVLLLAFFIYKSLSVLLLLFIALLFATAIEPVVQKLRRGPFSRSTGTLVVYSVVFLILGIIGYILVSVFVSQLGDFSTGLTKSIANMQSDIKDIDSQFIRDQATILLKVAHNFVSQFGKSTGERPANGRSCYGSHADDC